MLMEKFITILMCFLALILNVTNEEIIGCGGFVKSNFYIQYSKVEIKLYTKTGSLKYQTDCAPHNGYYLIPLYDKGDYVLKIEPPSGWAFEPDFFDLHVDGVSDPCSRNQDINFNFKGFTIFGKVLSYHQNDGPSGIKVELKKPSGDTLQETVTETDGSYIFTAVLPGSYIIEASHSTWLFDQNIENIKLEQDNIKTANKIIVAGFDVKGFVSSEDESIQGVHFLLFSREEPMRKPTGCNPKKVNGFTQPDRLHYICHATSGKSGDFIFPSVPNGKYTLIPFHKGEHIEFDVSPSKVEFEVKNEGHIFNENFQVEGFSVSGRVLESVDGKGLENAEIYINGKLYTSTESNGIYHLENMRAGMYDVEVKMQNFLFKQTTMKVTPSTPQLPEIYAVSFDACGHIEIEIYPPNLVQHQRTLSVKDISSGAEREVNVDENGNFCTMMSTGAYEIKPIISDVENKNGLKFHPPQIKLDVKHKPILNIAFSQVLGVVHGKVDCISSCKPLNIKATSAEIVDFQLDTTVSADGTFKFERCLPTGKYLLTVEKENYCFNSESTEFYVFDKNAVNVKLHQTGFQIIVKLTHSSAIKIKYPSQKVFTSDLNKGTNSLCLPEAGEYEVSLSGCYVDVSEKYIYDTKNPKEISMTPYKYVLWGTVTTELVDSDMSLHIDEQPSGHSEKLHLFEPQQLKNNTFKYTFSILVRPHTEWKIKVISSYLLFYPPVVDIKIFDSCIENGIDIIGKKGLFIHGDISPVLENVKIKILDKKSNIFIAEIFTNAEGKFKFGPLHEENDYVVTAEKEGYFFTPHGKLGSFKAYKLAEIVVKIENEYGKPLPGVLLSLSGGVDYRKNSLTRKDGKISFIGLSPGQYFLRPMLKEYQFQPSTKMIDIKEGTQIAVNISGKRVSYSLFGNINSLTGEAEVGVAIEAIGIDYCINTQEDAISEQGGGFRIRGLEPGCKYSLQIKNSSDVNEHIERATPQERTCLVENTDINDVRMIVFRQFSQLDISGIIFTDPKYLQTLKVRLYSVENQDQPIHTVNIGHSSFFYLPSVPVNQRKQYILCLDSSLSLSDYQYQTTPFIFSSNNSFYHFSFTFNPVRKYTEPEFYQGSIIGFSFTILIIVIMYYNSSEIRRLISLIYVLS